MLITLSTLAWASDETGSVPPVVVPTDSATTAATPPAATPELRDVEDWVRWKRDRQVDALPIEARLFYRRGLMAQQSGQSAEAIAYLRGAIELDPSFVEPHLTLAGWAFPADPAQVLAHLGAVAALVRSDFQLQLAVVANAITLGLEALFAGLLLTALFVLVRRRHELAHTVHEELSRVISRRTAHWWAPVVVVLPFLAGLGITLPVLALLAFLWSVLRVRERALTVALTLVAVTAPFATGALDRFTQALRTDAAPFHETLLVRDTPFDAERQQRIADNAARHPDDGFAWFALGWHARRGGDLVTAERAYRSALRTWPAEPSVWVNLGNVEAMRGRTDAALESYREALRHDPSSAPAHFNASQLHLRRFEYEDANRELRAASALDFDLVNRYQSRTGASGLLPLVDAWPAPQLFWGTLARTPIAAGTTPLPLLLRGRIEASGWPFSVATLAVVLGFVLLGRWQMRRLPLRQCNNCAVVVCRRCARRRRETMLCPACDRIAAGATTVEFSKSLLQRHRNQHRDRRRLGRTALATLVPGYGLVAHHRVFGPAVILATTWFLGRLLAGAPMPYSLTPRLSLPGSELPPQFLLVALVVVQLWSLTAYLVVMARDRRREAQLEAASRGRITQSTARTTGLAA
ncbi:MAG: tetratricopeptide repeat protein [bacterium]